jgi:hypothetical protein
MLNMRQTAERLTVVSAGSLLPPFRFSNALRIPVRKMPCRWTTTCASQLRDIALGRKNYLFCRLP